MHDDINKEISKIYKAESGRVLGSLVRILGEFSVSDGPFIEGKELIPGFTVINVDTKEEAIEWAKELRACMGDGILKMARLSYTGEEDL